MFEEENQNQPQMTRAPQSLTAASGLPGPQTLDPNQLAQISSSMQNAGTPMSLTEKDMATRGVPFPGPTDAMPIKRSVPRKPYQPQAGETDVNPAAGLAPRPQPAAEPMLPPGPQIGDMITTERSTTQNILPPQYGKKAQELENALIAKTEADRKVAEADFGLKQEQAAMLKAEADRAAAQNAMLQQRMEANRIAQEKAIAEYKANFDKYAAMKVQNPWSTASTGSKIMSAVAIGLGEIIKDPGGPNVLKQIIDDKVKQDIELQKLNIDKKKGEFTLLQQYARDLRQQGMDDLDITKSMDALAKQSLADQFKAMSAQMAASQPVKAQALEGLSTQLAQDAFNIQRQVAQDLGAKTTTTQMPLMPGKAEKAQPLPKNILEDIQSAEKSIKGVRELTNLFEKNIDNIGPIAGRINTLKSQYLGDAGLEDFVKLDQAQREALTQKLNEITGAQMTDKEWVRIAPMIPSPNDPAETVRAKLDRMNATVAPLMKNTLDRLATAGYNVGGFYDLYGDMLPKQDVKGFKPR